MPDAHTTRAGLWAPVRHARHPRVWGWLLAACAADIALFGLRFDALYHYRRFADELLDDDDPNAIRGNHHIFDSLPISLIRIEMMSFCATGIEELPVTPADDTLWKAPLLPQEA
jgi:hypothetical protein